MLIIKVKQIMFGSVSTPSNWYIHKTLPNLGKSKLSKKNDISKY